jgi:copper chaperone CopZ
MRRAELLTFKIAAALTLAQVPGLAQVEKVEILTSGISCGVCAAVSEVQFRRMEGIDKVTINLPKEAITLHYKADAGFSAQALQRVLDPLNVQILRLRIAARGRIEDGPAGKKSLVAGRNRFVVWLPAGAGMIDPKEHVFVEGLLIGRGETMECKVATVTIREDGEK